MVFTTTLCKEVCEVQVVENNLNLIRNVLVVKSFEVPHSERLNYSRSLGSLNRMVEGRPDECNVNEVLRLILIPQI